MAENFKLRLPKKLLQCFRTGYKCTCAEHEFFGNIFYSLAETIRYDTKHYDTL